MPTIDRSSEMVSCRNRLLDHEYGTLNGVEGGKATLKVGLEIVDILEPDVEPQGRSARRPFGRRTIGGAVKRNHKALQTAPSIAHAQQLHGLEQGIDRILR